MADVTGPISTLPGSVREVPNGTICDNFYYDKHLFPVSATRRVQGETDSFGSEMIDLCECCYKEMQEAVEKEREPGGYMHGACDWCKKGPFPLKETRDFDEGSSGPVYLCCSGCRQKQNDDIARELDDDGNDSFDEDEYICPFEAYSKNIIDLVMQHMASKPIGKPAVEFVPVIGEGSGSVSVSHDTAEIAIIIPRVWANGRESFPATEHGEASLMSYPNNTLILRGTYEEIAKRLTAFQEANGEWETKPPEFF
jgi:hypothetical protein